MKKTIIKTEIKKGVTKGFCMLLFGSGLSCVAQSSSDDFDWVGIGGTDNCAYGINVMPGVTAVGNTGTGNFCLESNINGEYNTASGWQALNQNVAGSYNNAFGFHSMFSNSSGSNIGDHNVALGYESLYSNVDGAKVIREWNFSRRFVQARSWQFLK